MEIALFENQVGNFVGNIFFDLLDEDNIKTLLDLTEEANEQFKRGDLIEEIFNQWSLKYKNYTNLNDAIPNYKALDFDGGRVDLLEVVSLKTYHLKLATEKTLSGIKTKINTYANKLNAAQVEAAHASKTKVLDFTIKKGEWDNLMPQINTYIESLENSLSNVSIRITEF